MTPQQAADDVARDGVALWPGFIDDHVLGQLRDTCDALASGSQALHFPKSTRVWDLFRHGEPFLDLLTLPLLEEAIGSILGRGFLLSDYSLNVVQPGQPIDAWHIDYPYNEMERLVTGSPLGVQCVLTLSDFTETNGGTQYHPGSHNPPRRPPAEVDVPPSSVVAPSGSLFIMAATTWHRSGLNTSTQPRSAILLSFVEKWVRTMSDPPEPGPWSQTQYLRRLLAQERPPETINGVPVDDPTAQRTT